MCGIELYSENAECGAQKIAATDALQPTAYSISTELEGLLEITAALCVGMLLYGIPVYKGTVILRYPIGSRALRSQCHTVSKAVRLSVADHRVHSPQSTGCPP